ncbi:cyclic di-AMP binding protein CbpA [Bacillus toyonensis]|uniref:cyclic di-AMP binding protein CbpA n=1 Tax=Bacillus toyonensis TaxID=155322 RepID=UPI003D648E4B
MRIKGHYVEKRDVISCKISDTLEQAWIVLQQSGFRCIPVLDEEEQCFKGNIYEVDLLKKMDHSSKKLPVRSVMKDTAEYIKEDASFYQIFFTIKRLPYIAIVGEDERFLGILTHAKVIGLLQEAWGDGCTLTLGTMEHEGDLQHLTKAINKYTTIKSLVTLDNESLVRRILVTLPNELTPEDYEKVKAEIDHIGFRIVYEEKTNVLQTPNKGTSSTT